MDFAITAELIKPIETAISSGLTTLVPVGLMIMGAMVGISLIPRIIYKFL
ncbi:hypothetical protein [Ruminococcus sp.]|nr:hypothetical protein [Ruminococcus sp.]